MKAVIGKQLQITSQHVSPGGQGEMHHLRKKRKNPMYFKNWKKQENEFPVKHLNHTPLGESTCHFIPKWKDTQKSGVKQNQFVQTKDASTLNVYNQLVTKDMPFCFAKTATRRVPKFPPSDPLYKM